MANLYPYTFNNTGRIGNDATDLTQQNIANTQYNNHMLANYFSNKKSDDHVNFAVQQPTMSFNGLTNGNGLNGDVVDTESILKMKTGQERAFEKLQLFSRPYATVPYLGRGSCNTNLESQLQQGEIVSDKKSVSTIMENSFNDYFLYPTDTNMVERTTNASHMVEEAALDGWVRGGITTREMSISESMKKQNRA
jgi:hypothetical protein